MKEDRWSFIHLDQGHFYLSPNFDVAVAEAIQEANTKEDLLIVQVWKPMAQRGTKFIVHSPGIKFPDYRTKQDIVDIYKRQDFNVRYILDDKYQHYSHNKHQTKSTRW